MFEPQTIALTIAAFLVGGLVKGTIGLGIPVVVLAVLVFVMPLRDAMAVFLLPGLAANLWQATTGPWLGVILRRLSGFLLAAVAGILIGVAVMAGSRSETMVTVLGCLLIAYSSYTLMAPRLPAPGRHERWMSPLAGGVGGALFGMTGLFIVPALLFVETLRMPRDQFVQALGVIFVTISATLALTLAGHRIMTIEHILLSLVGMVPVFVGLVLGRRLRHRISEDRFRQLFFIALICVGGYMIFRTTVGLG